jgi:hypothetical protein
VIKIYDDVVEEHVAELIASEMKNIRWKFDYSSKANHQSRHWHVLCGHDSTEMIANGFEWVMPIWTSAMFKYEFKKKHDIDINAYT